MACREVVDCERLIKEVEKRPALYDFKLKDYCDKHVRRKLWTEVCEAVFSDWNYLTSETKKDKGLLLQRRWKSLRECFRRELKAQQGMPGDGGSNRKKYMHFDQLLFLISTLDERPACSNYSASQCDLAEELGEGTIEVTPPNLETPERPQEQSKTKDKAKKSYEKPIDVLKNKAQEDTDEDEYFLMSLLPKFKKFNDDQRFEAQLEILKIMRGLQQRSTQGPTNEYHGTIPSTHAFYLPTFPPYILPTTQGHLPHRGHIPKQHQVTGAESHGDDNLAFDVEGDGTQHSVDSQKSTNIRENSSPVDPIPMKRPRRQITDVTAAAEGLIDPNKAINHPEQVDEECGTFGRHVAVQLKQLPTTQRILAQDEIQKVLTRYRLAAINAGPTASPQTSVSDNSYTDPVTIVKEEIDEM
ncbi:uncharacterized protein LOC135216735 [Macrobrachium nipponense]|uniref:uncharacterized protein LOC135216735 n=1 Tax=Macrobrachium nipponense TaxID=159736 RepID=UPI0030C86A59